MTIASRRDRVFRRFPDPVVGYELNPNFSYFSIIIPEATTNLVTNPSMEYSSNGYTVFGGGLSWSYAWQAYGTYCLALTPAVSTESGAYYGNVTLANGTTYTASVTIQGEEGKKYYIWLATTAGALIGTKRLWIGTGHKQRIWVTHTETTGADRRVYVTRDAAYADQNVFYMDGLQVEAKSYPTTYCDGTLKGFVVGQTAYWWNGTPHMSTSSRSAQTRAGGREMSLIDFGIRVLAIMGLGMAPLVDQSLAMPGRGELFQGTGTTAREFSLVTALYADGDQGRHLQAERSTLIDALKPDLVTYDQPLILRYQNCDDEGDPLGESLDIICKYQGGLEGNFDNHQQERLVLNFKMHLPLIQNTYDNGTLLGYQTTVADADYVLMRTSAGIWQEMANGLSNSSSAIVEGNDGLIYVGGTFALAGGVANTARIASWNGTAWAALGTGADDGVLDLVIGSDGKLYAGGAFTGMGGVGNTDGIAVWDGANWAALGTGVSGGGALAIVWALAAGPDGSIYAGGSFTQMGGVAGTARIARWYNGVWYPMGAGIDDGFVHAITVAPNGNVYVAGDFSDISGVGFGNIAMWDGVHWNKFGSADPTGAGIGMNNQVRALYLDPAGALYAGGYFTLAGLTEAHYIAKWNGVQWLPLASGLNSYVLVIKADQKGLIHAAGEFSATMDGVFFPDSLAIWNGTSWLSADVNLPGAAQFLALCFDRSNQAYLGFTTSGDAVSATVTVPTIGSAASYPQITFLGPGVVHQLKNYTTGKAIYFDLTLLAGEGAVLTLNPTQLTFYSSFRGNILNTILPGSNMDFQLLPGSNNISSYIFGGTTATSKIFMDWRGQYWSLDGAAWK